MTDYLARSRVTKALTDANLVGSFAAAEAALDAVLPTIVVGADAARSPAGQIATLTALVTAFKCFGRVRLAGEGLGSSLHQPLLIGSRLDEVARSLGATVSDSVDPATTHLVRIGSASPWRGWQVSVWWNGWLAGTRPFSTPLGRSSLPLAGLFAGALAIRQIFAHVRQGRLPREEIISLWEPQSPVDFGQTGPTSFTMPTRLWLVGLGHLGQAFAWGLLSLPLKEERYVILQDDQWVSAENVATSLLVLPGDLTRRKARVVARWLDHAGWTTELIERRHNGDIARTPTDPTILLAGLDDVRPRRTLAANGFDYMIDAGIGRGARDFESLQIRSIPAGTPVAPLWIEANDHNTRDHLRAKEAYASLEREVGTCGIIPFADASVSVPFVGAATAALTLAQLARLGAMKPAVALLQVELGTPTMVIDGGATAPPESFLGGEVIAVD